MVYVFADLTKDHCVDAVPFGPFANGYIPHKELGWFCSIYFGTCITYGVSAEPSVFGDIPAPRSSKKFHILENCLQNASMHMQFARVADARTACRLSAEYVLI